MAKQRGLGKGLSVLIPMMGQQDEKQPDEPIANQEEIKEIPAVQTKMTPWNDLEPNPFQPRRVFDQEQLDELTSSIKEHGIIQPIVVRKKNGRLQIVAGERRWRAARQAGLAEVPTRELELSDTQVMELALVENLQREDLSCMDIALGIQELISKLSITHDEVAHKIGISRAAVTNKLRLLQLPPEVIAKLKAEAISEGHARALLGLSTPEKMVEFAELVEKNGLNVRQLEEMVKRLPVTEKMDAAFPQKQEPESEFEEELALLNTNYNLNIKVAGSKKNMGIVIKGLKKWQVQLLLEYIEEHNEELFPRE